MTQEKVMEQVIGNLGMILAEYELMMRQDKPRLSITTESILSITIQGKTIKELVREQGLLTPEQEKELYAIEYLTKRYPQAGFDD